MFRSLWFRFIPPELSGACAVFACKHNLIKSRPPVLDDVLRSTLWGREFKNPVGLAAGFDKNAECIKGVLNQGFGFVEVGTVTPRPQSGNKKPRIFRLIREESVRNFCGFNGKGSAYVLNQMKSLTDCADVIGINISRNKDSESFVKDVLYLLDIFSDFAGYFVLNISSPNTQNLRDISGYLNELLKAVSDCRKSKPKFPPVLLKLSPDMNEKETRLVCALSFDYAIDGMIISNTSAQLAGTLKGGVSGKMLTELSTEVLASIYRQTEGLIPIIGCGGVFTAEDAYKKISYGASLIQLYTAMVYKGFSIVNKINQGLIRTIKEKGFSNIKEAVGSGIN